MKTGLRISVLISVYNAERYIERCLQSVINQTLTEGVECIICNDCSTDSSFDIVKRITDEYDGPIQFRIIEHEKNRGVAAAKNSLLSAAKGDYLQFVDSDDYIEPQMLELMYVEALRCKADIVGCDIYNDYGSKKECNQFSYIVNTDSEYYLRATISGTWGRAIWSRMIKRELYDNNHIRAIDGLRNGEDVPLVFAIHFYAQRVSYVPVPLYNYYDNTESITRKRISYRKLEDKLIAYKVAERFMMAHGIWDDYKEDFGFTCFLAKMPLILDRHFRDFRQWKNTFSESNKYIDRYFASWVKRFYWKSILYAPAIVRPIWYFAADVMSLRRSIILRRHYK